MVRTYIGGRQSSVMADGLKASRVFIRAFGRIKVPGARRNWTAAKSQGARPTCPGPLLPVEVGSGFQRRVTLLLRGRHPESGQPW